ncbi:MAG TPA: hypothetical protein VF708_15335 [Pyrinomonadaceae bacterium]|jgi:hypothetical protein
MKVTELDAARGRLMTLFFLSLSICVGGSALAVRARVPHPQNGHKAVGSQNTAAKAEAAILRLFGAGIEVAKDRKPYFLTGDFNGDSRHDLIALIHLKQAKSSLPKGVVVLNPWGYERKNSQGTSDLALVIIHGAAAGWDTQTPAGRYLLTDRDYFSTPIWEEPGGSNLLSLRKKRPPRGSRAEAAPGMARGDAVAIPTEAGIDIYLYWNGKTYKVYEPAEEP